MIEIVVAESGACKDISTPKLQSKFGVDISSFEFERHFRCEPCFKGVFYFLRKLKYRNEHVAACKEPVTIAQLVNACEKKVWQYDV